MTKPLSATACCQECGMPVANGEYHPYAACLMFKACGNSESVKANLEKQLRAKANKVDDLVMLVRQLANALRNTAPNNLENTLPDKALDYLKRAGLSHNELRNSTAATRRVYSLEDPPENILR
jgi:hypothetical protein